MSNNIPSVISPFIEDGKIIWYYQDTFPISFQIEIVDSVTGDPIEYRPEDEIIISFYTKEKPNKMVHTFVGNFNEDNTIVLYFNEEISQNSYLVHIHIILNLIRKM